MSDNENDWEETTRLHDLPRRRRAETASLPAEGIPFPLPFEAPLPTAEQPAPATPRPDQTLDSWSPGRSVPPPQPPRARRSPPPPRPMHHADAWTPPEARPVRPPNPIAEVRPPPPPRRPQVSVVEPEPSPPTDDEDASAVHVLELIWTSEDEAAIERARRWDREHDDRLPRMGARAVEPRRGAAWLTQSRVAQHADICAATSAGATKPPARVVEGTLTFDLDPAEELKATRAALRRVAPHHPELRRTMESTEGLAEDPLTPLAMLRTAVLELVLGASKAGMTQAELKRQTRDTLMRNRKHAELHILGGDHLVARLRLAQDEAPWVAYIPKDAVSSLPLMSELTVRAAVTVHARQDPEEKGTHGLRIAALARFVETTEAPAS